MSGRRPLTWNLVRSTGNNNTALGSNALSNITGSNNIALGAGAGENHTTGGNNIYIGNGGALSEFRTIRIGAPSTHGRTLSPASVASPLPEVSGNSRC